MVDRFLIAYIAQDADLSAVLGNRFRPIAASQGLDRPYATYQVIGDGSSALEDFAGSLGADRQQVQINIVSDHYAEARDIANKFTGRKGAPKLHKFRGTIGGVVVKACVKTDQRDIEHTPTAGEGRGPAEIQLDFDIVYEELVAV